MLLIRLISKEKVISLCLSLILLMNEYWYLAPTVIFPTKFCLLSDFQKVLDWPKIFFGLLIK